MKLKALNTALCMAAALTVPSLAQATAVATGYIDVSNAQFTNSDGTTVLLATQFNFTSLQNSGSATTALGSYPGPVLTASGPSATRTMSDVLAGNGAFDLYSHLGSGGTAQGLFTTPVITPPTDQFSVAESKLSGGIVDFYNPPTVPVHTATADAQTYGATSITGAAQGQAHNNIGAVSDVQFNAGASITGAHFLFNISDYYNVYADGGQADTTATVKGSFSASLVDNTALAAAKALPHTNASQTTIRNAAIAAATQINYSYLLGGAGAPASGYSTSGTTASFNNTGDVYSGLTIYDLTFNFVQGDAYHFILQQNIDTAATNVARVPEPATLALIGLGLLGFGATRKKGFNA